MSNLTIVILAAGQGTRMKSRLPKVLHPLAGRPLLAHVIDTARSLKPAKIIIVYGHGGEQVPETLASDDLTWVEQTEQLGTGHAVEQAMAEIDDESNLLILYGDVPFTQTNTLAEMVRLGSEGFGLLTVHLSDPTGYGRIVRNSHGEVLRIVEEKDASEAERGITEINSGIMCTSAKLMRDWLGRLENNNAQKEFYLTDTIAMAVATGVPVNTAHPAMEQEVIGINSRSQLAELERYYQLQLAEQLMASGVTIIDPSRLDIRGDVQIATDVTIDINVILQGNVRIEAGASIGPNCVIIDSSIGEGAELLPNCVIENSSVGAGCQLGPFARLRPGAMLSDNAKVGNFVEIKNSSIGRGSKVNHLSYIGDTSMGEGVNIGAGTITANYDGANKHRTVIEDKVSTGANSVMVAPVTIETGATIGAGSVITKTAPEGQLTLTRAKQVTIEGWQRPVKK